MVDAKVKIQFQWVFGSSRNFTFLDFLVNFWVGFDSCVELWREVPDFGPFDEV